LNVGDIKPAEYAMQLFMDMGYDATPFEDAATAKTHMNHFYSSIFGEKYGKSIADIQEKYFDLAFERKPEFMGWSQTEPTTKTKQTAYNPFFFGDENQRRIAQYQNLENQVETVKNDLPKSLQDSFFELVYYPVKASSLMNKKFLYADKANIYGKQGRLNAKEFALKSEAAYNEIKTITQEYNQIANGKWKFIMDMSPRKLPVFDKATIEIPLQIDSVDSIGIMAENETDLTTNESKLPMYSQDSNATHFVDLFLKKEATVNWKLINVPDWIITNKSEGILDTKNRNSERIQISIDWKKWNKKQPKTAKFTINYGSKTKTVTLNIDDSSANLPKNSFVAMEDKVVIYAQNYTSIQNKEPFKWEKIDGLGYSKVAMQAYPLATISLPTENLEKTAPYLEYKINLNRTDTLINPELILYALPTLPMTNKQGVRVGVQWNDEPVQIIDFATVGRSEEWKQNVLSNKASKKITLKSTIKGTNTLKVYMIDEGVALDYFYINLNKNNPVPYSILPETICR
jgi:hypothetical protein